MRVLFVSSGNSKDGISPIVRNQGQSLINRGTKIIFFTINGKGLFSYLKHIFILRNFLKLNNYEIIHAHYGFSGIVALMAKRKEKIIVSFMGDDLLGSVNENGNTSVSSYFGTLVNKFLAKYFFDFNIVKSQNLKRTLFSKTESIVIPNGINCSQFYPFDKIEARKALSIPLDQKIVLFAANPFRLEKNYKLAEDALKLLPESKIVIKTVYDVNQQILCEYYNASDVILLTSFHEGSPNVIKEAMACNSVILSTDVGDVRQNFQNAEGCFICSFDPEDVADNIELAIEFSNKYGHSNGRERILELGLGSETVAQKIIEVYNKVLNPRI